MYEYYTIAHVALITGLTDRTVRSHIRSGLLEGVKINGLWHFTPEQISQYIAHPAVSPSIKARRNALVHDFLLDEHKRTPEMCFMIDEPARLAEANAASEFFCHAINEEFAGKVRFGFSFERGFMRIILKGDPDAVRILLNRYHETR